MNREQLQAELDKTLADLEDLEEQKRAFLGQTGVHIRMRVLEGARRRFKREEARLKERSVLPEKLLHRGDDHAGGES